VNLSQLYRSRLGRNIVSNYLGMFWLAALSLIAVPIYVHLLGRTGWAIVAASMAIQMFLSFLDAGFGQVMPRWLAQASDSLFEQAKLYRIFSGAFIALGLTGFLLGQAFAGTLARTWFNTGQIPPGELELGIRIVLFQFLFQFGNSANIGYWNGIQLQTLANVRQCLFMTLKHAAATLSIVFIARSPMCYLISFAALGATEFLVNRLTVVRRLGNELVRARQIDRDEIKRVVIQAGSFSVAVLVGTLVSQLDRIVLSNTQDLVSFGTYAIVASLGLSFMQFAAPVGRAFLPRLALDFSRNTGDLHRTTFRLFLTLLLVCVLPCLAVGTFAPLVLKLWIHNATIVADGTFPLRLLLVAVVLNAIYNLFYGHMIISGNGAVPVAINIACLVASLLAVAFVGTHIGIALGGVIWIASTSTQLVLGATWYFLFYSRGPSLGVDGLRLVRQAISAIFRGTTR